MVLFLVKSSWGNSYAMILYDYDSNSILTRDMKNQTKEAITEKYEDLHGTMVSQGLIPQMQRLDN